MSGLDDLADSFGSEDFESLNERRFEAKVVSEILKFFNLQSVKNQLYDAAEEAVGERILTFDTFFERFPDFPIYLRPTYIPKVREKMDTWVLVNHFEKAPAVKAWYEVRFGSALECPIGIVYNWPQHVRFLVLHNAPLDSNVQGFRPGIWVGDGCDPLVIDPLRMLLESVARQWTPDS